MRESESVLLAIVMYREIWGDLLIPKSRHVVVGTQLYPTRFAMNML